MIILKNGERINDATISSISDTTILCESNGDTIKVPKNTVEAIFYSDGLYVEISSFTAETESSNLADELLFPMNMLPYRTSLVYYCKWYAT